MPSELDASEDAVSYVRPNELDPELYQGTGRRLRLLRLLVTNGGSQKLWCEQHGFSQMKWNNYERGRHLPPVTDALRLKKRHGVTLD